MFIDSHCHLDMLLDEENSDVAPFIARAHAAAVTHFLCVSVQLSKLSKMIEISASYPEVFYSAGLHPNEFDEPEPDLNQLCEFLSLPKMVAVGETGLDYYRTAESEQAKQQARFRLHIAAAKKMSKPLIIHTRAAKTDTIAILQEEQAQTIGGVMHCFTEDWATAKAALDLGFYISFSGIVTFKNAVELQEVARQIPLNRLLVETDCPYLAPVPFRGKKNEPAYVAHVAKFLSELRGESLETLAAATTQNFFDLFKISS
jgi:TatD DNase family protein